MNLDFTAIILSGGKSIRLGEDKAFLRINNLTIVERIYNLLQNIFPEVLIISNESNNYKFLTNKIFNDIYVGFGPLSGIHSGLFHSETENNFIISCDMPFVNHDAINFIISQNSNHDIIIPKSKNKFHSLCGIYKKTCLANSENLLKSASSKINTQNGKTKVKLFDLINSVNTNFLEISNEKFFNDDLFFNMNSIEDYEYVKSKLKK